MSAELIDAARTTPILPGMSLLSTRGSEPRQKIGNAS
jgi:hypothetical protein